VKVYISADMEGIAGHTGWQQVEPGTFLYRAAQERMTDEVNAAVDAAFAAGATLVVVNDSHDGMRNLIPERLDARARLLQGSPKPYSMVEGAEAGYDVAFFVGYHAMGGGPGVLAHTYSLDPLRVTLNGLPVGETGLNALVLGAYGTPVALVTGDDRLAAEVSELLPWATSVVVKEARGRFGALSLSPSAAAQAIRDGVRAAFARRAEWKPFTLAAPITVELELPQAGQADLAALVPLAERVGPRTVRYVAPDPLTAYRAFRTMNNMAGLARD
jgi:D-amino peptidase